MTDDEARETLRGGSGWVSWSDGAGRPHWVAYDEPTITLDGEFTAKELLAILHFAPREGV
jgi:hypothetical protein